MFGFLNRPSLASGTAACVVGIMVVSVGAYFAFSGLHATLETGWGRQAIAMAGAGLGLLFGGAALLGVGVRAMERFERKLLIHIASRGRLDG